jgi:hypothetical protein
MKFNQNMIYKWKADSTGLGSTSRHLNSNVSNTALVVD